MSALTVETLTCATWSSGLMLTSALTLAQPAEMPLPSRVNTHQSPEYRSDNSQGSLSTVPAEVVIPETPQASLVNEEGQAAASTKIVSFPPTQFLQLLSKVEQGMNVDEEEEAVDQLEKFRSFPAVIRALQRMAKGESVRSFRMQRFAILGLGVLYSADEARIREILRDMLGSNDLHILSAALGAVANGPVPGLRQELEALLTKPSVPGWLRIHVQGILQ